MLVQVLVYLIRVLPTPSKMERSTSCMTTLTSESVVLSSSTEYDDCRSAERSGVHCRHVSVHVHALSLSLCALAHRVWVIKGNVDPQSIKVITTLGDQVVVHAVNEGSHHAGCRQR